MKSGTAHCVQNPQLIGPSYRFNVRINDAEEEARLATPDEVRISRGGEDAIIEFIDDTLATTHLKLEIKKELPMRLQEWEATIQEITVECTHDHKGAGKVLIAWRAKLETEPNLLQPFQIDEIVREVRQRLDTDGQSRR